jgi:hypothetical protein
MTILEFDEALNDAASVQNFGMLGGFGGAGSNKVWDRLPKPVQELYKKWNLPVALLAGRNPGPAVRDYAKCCGLPAEADIAALPSTKGQG